MFCFLVTSERPRVTSSEEKAPGRDNVPGHTGAHLLLLGQQWAAQLSVCRLIVQKLTNLLSASW